MALFTGTGPLLTTVTVFVPGTDRHAEIFSDVGMTVPKRNPFAITDSAVGYTFYAAAAYVVLGLPPAIYVSGDVHTFDEYQAPMAFPGDAAGIVR